MLERPTDLNLDGLLVTPIASLEPIEHLYLILVNWGSSKGQISALVGIDLLQFSFEQNSLVLQL